MKWIFITFSILLIGYQLIAQDLKVQDFVIHDPKAKLLYETEKGIVYALPQDNMRSLVITIQSDMPVYDFKIPGYIPNPLLHKGEILEILFP